MRPSERAGVLDCLGRRCGGLDWWQKAISTPAVSPPIFFLSAFLLGLCTNLLSARLDKTGIGSIVLVAVLAAVALVVLGPSVRQLWAKEEVAAAVKVGSPVPHKWLVVLASSGRGTRCRMIVALTCRN